MTIVIGIDQGLEYLGIKLVVMKGGAIGVRLLAIRKAVTTLDQIKKLLKPAIDHVKKNVVIVPLPKICISKIGDNNVVLGSIILANNKNSFC